VVIVIVAILISERRSSRMSEYRLGYIGQASEAGYSWDGETSAIIDSHGRNRGSRSWSSEGIRHQAPGMRTPRR
jgi:hypothetical protein